MTFKLRYFSVDEAEGLIPSIVEILNRAQNTKNLIENKVNEWRKQHAAMTPDREALVRSQVEFLASQLENQLGEITELGCIPKDLDLGLVDFASRIDGQEGYLCWKLGEASISHWHGLTDGYTNRRPLKKSS